MTPARGRCAVIAVAFGASLLTAAGLAVAEPAQEPAATAAPATSLTLRPSKPLDLGGQTAPSGVGFKLLAVALAGALGAYAWRHRQVTAAPSDLPALRIMRRLSVGARSELMVVEMNGQRLLLGVTPSSIQNLYILPSSDDVEAAADEPDRAVSRPLPPEPARTQETTVTRPRAVRRQYDVLEEQAAGIRAIVERK